MKQEIQMTGSTVEIGFAIQKMVQDGWTIDENSPLTFTGWGTVEVGFVRDPSEEQLQKEKEEREKLTRPEILAKARAAKAANAAAKKEETANV